MPKNTFYELLWETFFFAGDQLDGSQHHSQVPAGGLNNSQSDTDITQDEVIDHGNQDDLQLSALQEYLNMIDNESSEGEMWHNQYATLKWWELHWSAGAISIGSDVSALSCTESEKLVANDDTDISWNFCDLVFLQTVSFILGFSSRFKIWSMRW